MPLPKEYEKYGFSERKKVVRRLVATGEGGPGRGKSRLGYLTMPRPLLIIQGDMNDEHLREELGDELSETVHLKEIVFPPFIGVHSAKQRDKDYDNFKDNLRSLYTDAVLGGYFRSIMIDEGMWLYNVVRRAYLEDLGFGGEKQQSYSSVNSAMSRFYTLAKQNKINLYIPHRQVDEREKYKTDSGSMGSRQTGRKVAGGWKDSLYESQIHFLFDYNEDYDPSFCAKCEKTRKQCKCSKFVKPPISDKFQATIIKCSAKPGLIGRVLVGDEIAWPVIGQLVFPNSEESDWV